MIMARVPSLLPRRSSNCRQSRWGDEKGKQYLDGLKANKVKLAGSNGESADFVASGEFEFALVDSDDAVAPLRQGKPLEIVYPDQGEGEVGVLILPNAVALIRGGPHPDNGKKLIDYLVSKETERKLDFADCAQTIASRRGHAERDQAD